MPPKLYLFLRVYFFSENMFLFTDFIKNDNHFHGYARTRALYEIYKLLSREFVNTDDLNFSASEDPWV